MELKVENYILIFFIFMFIFQKIINILYKLTVNQMEYKTFYEEMFNKDLQYVFDKFIEEK